MSLLDDYLTTEELAKDLGLCARTIIRWTRKPDGLPFTQLGGRRLFKRDTVIAWIDAQERRPNASRRAKAGK